MANTYSDRPQSLLGFSNANTSGRNIQAPQLQLQEVTVPTVQGRPPTINSMLSRQTTRDMATGKSASIDTRKVAVLEPIHQDPVYIDEVTVQSHVPARKEVRSLTRGTDEPRTRGTDEPRTRGTDEPRTRSKKERSVVYESNSIPFTSILTPMTGLEATNSTNGAHIQFELIRDHVTGMNTLTWEPFKGIILGGGTECLEVQQSITHLPDHINDLPITIEVRGVRKSSFVRIDPHTNHNIKFYLDITGKGTMISDNDKVFVPACTVSWKSKR